MKQKKPKAFLIHYTLKADDQNHTILIVHYDKKQAGEMFIEWAKRKRLYDNILSVVCIRAKSSEKTAFKDILNDGYIFEEQRKINIM